MLAKSALLLALASFVAAAEKHSELEVDTIHGPVVGHYAVFPTRGGTVSERVRAFLGMPYAVPPVGDLRWTPSVAPEPWTTPFNASGFGPGCYETVGEPGLIRQQPPVVESEDCLKINVWTPSADRIPEGGAAVMLWTHGGGFQWGTTETNLYNGANIVDNNEGVILVSYNYRLNLFGFPGNPALPVTENNLGLLDVRRAVEWTRDNIAAFGGDPTKIMLFGESAGGAATDHYAYAYKDDPIIRAASPQSGTMSAVRGGGNGTVGPFTGSAGWRALSNAFNCDITSYEENLECLRAVPAAQLKASTRNITAGFSPVIDERTIFSDTAIRLETGNYAHFPYLVGNTDQEMGDPISTKNSFTCPAARVALSHARYAPTWQWRFFGNFPTYEGMGLLGPFHGTELQMVFGNYNPTIQTDEQVAASTYIQGAWVAFAVDPENGLTEYGWPTIDTPGESLVLLAYNNSDTAVFVDPMEYHDGCF